MSNTVSSSTDQGVCTITLNRPEKLNAVNSALVAQTLEAFREANNDADTRVVILAY